jgi:hypothetical protein
LAVDAADGIVGSFAEEYRRRRGAQRCPEALVSDRRKMPASHVEASESTVYLGRDAVGSILVVQKGQVTATDATGKSLGTFRTDRDAMTAILARARAAKGGAQ